MGCSSPGVEPASFEFVDEFGHRLLTEHGRDGVLLDVVDQHPARIDLPVAPDRVHDKHRALELVFEVGRVDEDKLVVLRGKVDLGFEDFELVLRVLVEPDLADAQDAGTRREWGRILEARDLLVASASA